MKTKEIIKLFIIRKINILNKYLFKICLIFTLLILNILFRYFSNNYITNKLFINEISRRFKKEGKININEVECIIKKKKIF